MVFYPPSWVPKLPGDPPDDLTVAQFTLDEQHGRHPIKGSRPPFIDGLTGKSYTMAEYKQRVDWLARGLAKELGFETERGSEYDKVIGVFCVNTIDTMTLTWATHRIGGISTPANASYSGPELEHQLRDSGAKCLFTCLPLLQIAQGACKTVGIPPNRIYLIDVPEVLTPGMSKGNLKTVEDFIKAGKDLPPVKEQKLQKGEGAKRTAFLCYSSGTSGLPKGVMISHRNVIANVLQLYTIDSPYRDDHAPSDRPYHENVLGLLPFSHIYGLVVICQSVCWRGDSTVVLPKFELKSYLNAIQQYKIDVLYLVPPIIILMTTMQDTIKNYDLSTVKILFTGAAPLGPETASDIQKLYPEWIIRQGYGMTETCTVVCGTGHKDVWYGSCGSLLQGFEARLVTPEGKEITGYDERGELWVKSASNTLGYLNNAKATKETFEDGWVKTGDEAMIRKNPKSGFEHVWITDRIKELIKVKGLQVAPAELESHLLSHPSVDDCVVIGVHDDRDGEVPKAFVVKSKSVGLEESESMLKRRIARHVEKHKAKHKWLKGGVEFIDVVPKSPSGKILRRMIRDKEREKRKKQGPKL